MKETLRNLENNLAAVRETHSHCEEAGRQLDLAHRIRRDAD